MSTAFGYRPAFTSPFFPPSRGHNLRGQQIRDARLAEQRKAAEREAIRLSIERERSGVEARRRARLDRILYRHHQRPPAPSEPPALAPLLPMARVTAAVCMEHGVTMADVRGASRSRRIVAARFEAMFRCRGLGKSLTEVGRFFSRDHTSVLHGVRKYQACLAEEGKQP